MEKINWVIIKSRGRGIDYGVGTFICNMLQGLKSFPALDVYVVEIGGNTADDFLIEAKDGITYLYFRKAWHLAEKDTVSNLSKHARNTLRVLQTYIPNGRKTVVHLNFIYQHFLGKEFKKAYNAKIITTQHVFTEEFNSQLFGYDLERENFLLSDQIISVTKHGKEYLIERGNNGDKITPIYNGINRGLFTDTIDCDAVLEKYGVSNSEKFILYSGRLDPIKGLRYLAEAYRILAREIPDCRLIVAGDGDSRELLDTCQEAAANVRCLGFIPFQDLIAFYKCATIGVIPSLEEHCSYVALEMLHSGLPVVASMVGGLKEIFIHNENALLVDMVADSTNVFGVAPDVNLMAESMIVLLKDSALRKNFSTSAKARANAEFTAAEMARKYVELTSNK